MPATRVGEMLRRIAALLADSIFHGRSLAVYTHWPVTIDIDSDWTPTEAMDSSPNALHDAIVGPAREIAGIVGAMSDDDASRRPASGAWSAREIISHLCQTDNESLLDGIGRVMLEDTPRIEVTHGVTHYTPERHAMALRELIAAFLGQYELIADYVARLGDDQRARRAHITLLKGSPVGEYPTLAEWLRTIAGMHLAGHLDELRGRVSAAHTAIAALRTEQ